MTDVTVLGPPAAPPRRRLPDERPSAEWSFALPYQSDELFPGEDVPRVTLMPAKLVIGFYPDGTLGEIFLRCGPQGSTLSGLFDAWGRAASMLLQYGVPLADVIHSFRGFRFQPAGVVVPIDDSAPVPVPFVSDGIPPVLIASSVVDAVMQYLEVRLLGVRP